MTYANELQVIVNNHVNEGDEVSIDFVIETAHQIDENSTHEEIDSDFTRINFSDGSYVVYDS